MISGRASKKIPKGLENGKIFLGKQEKPIAVIKRCEIQGYLTDDFWSYYQCWTRFNAGLGLPFEQGWGYYPDKFSSIMQTFTNEWRIATDGKHS